MMLMEITFDKIDELIDYILLLKKKKELGTIKKNENKFLNKLLTIKK